MLRRSLANICQISGISSTRLVDRHGLTIGEVNNSENKLLTDESLSGILVRLRSLTRELGCGEWKEIWGKNNTGIFGFSDVGNERTIFVTSTLEPNLGRVRHEIERNKIMLSELN